MNQKAFSNDRSRNSIFEEDNLIEVHIKRKYDEKKVK